ncbi:hypothetical protein F4604DRAFT_1810522, partial [Suillus subluteus]
SSTGGAQEGPGSNDETINLTPKFTSIASTLVSLIFEILECSRAMLSTTPGKCDNKNLHLDAYLDPSGWVQCLTSNIYDTSTDTPRCSAPRCKHDITEPFASSDSRKKSRCIWAAREFYMVTRLARLDCPSIFNLIKVFGFFFAYKGRSHVW